MSVLQTLGEYLRRENEPFYEVKHRKIEVVYLIEVEGFPLFRTEGEESFNKATIFVEQTHYDVPVILPEKIKAKLRREFLEYLRYHYDRLDDKMKEKIISIAKTLGYKKVSDKGKWYCAIIPPAEGRKSETDAGLCGMCPHCLLFGTILTNSNSPISDSIGIKSRVHVDPAFGVVDVSRAIPSGVTHNRVGDGESVSTTGQSLFRSYHVVPGVVFVGKIVLSDVTADEAEAVIRTLANIRRLGGRETVYGTVRVKVIGIAAGLHERVSAYELAKHVLEEKHGTLTSMKDVEKTLKEYLEKKGFSTNIDTNLFEPPSTGLASKLWITALRYDTDILEFAVKAGIIGSNIDKKIEEVRKTLSQ